MAESCSGQLTETLENTNKAKPNFSNIRISMPRSEQQAKCLPLYSWLYLKRLLITPFLSSISYVHFFIRQGSCSPSCPRTQYVTKDYTEPLPDASTSTSRVEVIGVGRPAHPVLYCTGDWTQRFEQTLGKHSTKISAVVAPSDVLLGHSLHSSKHALLDLGQGP